MATRPITASRRPLTDSDNVGARRPLGLVQKDNLPVANAVVSKSHLKLEDKLSKAELKIQDLERHRALVHNEMEDLQTELRLAAQRETKLKQNVEKWEKSHSLLKEKTSKLTNLQGRLEELHKVHEESKTRRQKEIDELNEKLKRTEERKRHEVAEARKVSEAERLRAEELEMKRKTTETRIQTLQSKNEGSAEESTRIIEKLQAEKESIKVALMDAQVYSRQTETKMQQHIASLESQLQQQKISLDNEAQRQAHQTETAHAHLFLQIQTLTQDIESLEGIHEHNLDMIAKATHAHFTNHRQDSAEVRLLLQEELHNAVEAKVQAEWLAAERFAQLHEIREDLKHAKEDKLATQTLIATLTQDFDSVMAELRAERSLFEVVTLQRFEVDDLDLCLPPSTELELEALRCCLEDAQTRSAALDTELQDLHARYIEKVGEAKSANTELQTFKRQTNTLESALSDKSAELERATTQLAEMEVLRDRLRAIQDDLASAMQESRNHSEASKALSASLQNAKVAEQAWREERDRLALMLDEASKYEDLYNELSSQTRHLIERHALAEQEKATLSALNSELLGHTNPYQKIMYMDRVRRELDEVKEENISLRMQLQQMTTAKVDMEKELRSYKAVDIPLSQRPRTELTRVVRAADHDKLLRSVSYTLDRPSEPFVTLDPPVEAVEPVRVGTELEVISKPLKKRRSYGSISVHALDTPPSEASEEEDAMQDETIEAVPNVAATNRTRPRATLVNSGSLRQPSSVPVAITDDATLTAHAQLDEVVTMEEQDQDITRLAPVVEASTMPKAASRPGLGVSSLGIKARRVSELVRASSPPLPMISDVSSDVPNLMNSALPSPAPHLMTDWTMDTPGSAPMPLLRGEFGASAHTYGLTHSTPLVRPSARRAVGDTGPEDSRPRSMRRSRYSGAQRVLISASGLRDVHARTSLVIREENGEESIILEDQDDSLRQGWLDEGAHHNLPEFSIDGLASHTVTQRTDKPLPRKSKSSKARPSASKLVKPGPMARTVFR